MADKILLISANRCTAPDPVFPLGLACVNASLRQAGYETRWYDCALSGPTLESTLAAYRPRYVGISLRNVDDVMIQKRETYFDALSSLCQTVRQVNPCPVILGGSGFSIFPGRILETSGADYGIQGEGESSLPLLLKALEQGGPLEEVPGLVYRRDGRVVANRTRAQALDFRLAAEDRPVELVAHYLQISGMMNLQTQRGCAHLCCYCTYPLIEGRAWRRRPPEDIADEMAQLQARGAKYVFVVDSIFNSTPRHVMETCEAIIRRKLSIRWGCYLRPQGLTPELMHLMARAKLAHIEYGSDSFCDPVLKAYDKRFTFDEVLRSSELAQQVGIDHCHFVICGGPGETRETLWAGFENSRRLGKAIVMASVGMRVYPHTQLFQRAVREGSLDAGADLLEPVYYLAPGLADDEVSGLLQEFARRSPNWIVGDAPPNYARLVERLRRRDVIGPLWSYLAYAQRLQAPDGSQPAKP
jgi:radical SAM superfamily enzyme YgiQ (UPF0313 family)